MVSFLAGLSLSTMSLLHGYIEADPLLAGLAVAGIAVAAGVFTVRRVLQRRRSR